MVWACSIDHRDDCKLEEIGKLGEYDLHACLECGQIFLDNESVAKLRDKREKHYRGE